MKFVDRREPLGKGLDSAVLENTESGGGTGDSGCRGNRSGASENMYIAVATRKFNSFKVHMQRR